MRLLGFGSLVWICNVLLDKKHDKNTKLNLIHIHTVNRCYLFLFIVRLLIVGIIFSGYWQIFTTILGCYLSLSFITGIDGIITAIDEWTILGETTLYDIKQQMRRKII